MQWRTNVLVVANVTATSDELVSALTARAARGSVAFTLIVPTNPLAGARTAAHAQLAEAIKLLRARGLEVDGRVGPSDVIITVSEEWDPRRYDEIIISTLPMRFSKWLHAGLPERIERLTGAWVTHVVSQPPKPPVAITAAPAHEKRNPMGPLSVLVGRAQAAVALDQRDRLGQLRVRAGAASEDELAAGGLLSARTICGLSHVLGASRTLKEVLCRRHLS